MSNLYKLFSNNESMEKQGVDFEVAEGVIFRFKRMGGTNIDAVKKAMAKHYKPVAKSRKISDEKEKSILAKILIESCFVNMRGVTDADGNDLESTPENAYKVMMDLPELRVTLQSYVEDVTNFTEEDDLEDSDGEDLGNS